MRLVLALALLGCSSNSYRSPAFVGSRAPQPTVVTGALKCLAEHHEGADAVARALEVELRKGGELAPVDARSRLTLCDELANDSTLSTMGVDWEAGGRVIGPIAQDLARRYGARSILIPLVRSVNRCASRALSTECKEARVDVAMLLFEGSGVSLWRSVRQLTVPARGFVPGALEREVAFALAEVPAVRAGKLSAPRE